LEFSPTNSEVHISGLPYWSGRPAREVRTVFLNSWGDVAGVNLRGLKSAGGHTRLVAGQKAGNGGTDTGGNGGRS